MKGGFISDAEGIAVLILGGCLASSDFDRTW